MTKIEQTFDEFITAAAELAIKHVTTQVKTVLQSMTIYLVGAQTLGYNDEYHYIEEGMEPETFFLDRAEAEKYCLEANLKGWWMDSNWREIDDGNQDERRRLSEHIANAKGTNEYDITMKDLYEHCVASNIDVTTVMPQVYMVKELQ